MTLPHGLPASRTDALSLVVLGTASALLGAPPAMASTLAIVVTALANVWAIVSSMTTLHEVDADPSYHTEVHLRNLLNALLLLTIVTSLLTFVMLWCGECPFVAKCSFAIGSITTLTAFAYGLSQFHLAYTKGCQTTEFQESALCAHTPGKVIGTLVVTGVAGLGGVFFIWVNACSTSREFLCHDDAHGDTIDVDVEVGDNGYKEVDEDVPRSLTGATVARTSAFIKACLLGIYWVLFEPNLTWAFAFNGEGSVALWVTGQWAKQGVAVAMHLINQLYPRYITVSNCCLGQYPLQTAIGTTLTRVG